MWAKVNNLRAKIKARTAELGIVFESRPDGHWYGFGKPNYKSVTKKLQIIKGEGLMNWKMNRALEYLKEKIEILQRTTSRPEDWFNDVNVNELLQQAKLAPQQEFEGAGDIGKAVHKWREEWFSAWINTSFNDEAPVSPQFVPLANDPRPEVKASCEAIKRCVQQLQVQPLACELYLADEKLQIGGTLDDIWAVPQRELITVVDENLPAELQKSKKVKTKWETWLVDLKTSNIGNKDSYYMQVALYWTMFRKLYKVKIDKVFILHTSKSRFGDYELVPVKHPRRYLQMAKTAIKLDDDLTELRELKKPEIARI